MTKENVIKLLSTVSYPGFNRDIVSFGMVKDVIIDGQTVTNGGRVLASTGFGADVQEALTDAYRNLSNISFEGIYFRKDLGFDL